MVLTGKSVFIGGVLLTMTIKLPNALDYTTISYLFFGGAYGRLGCFHFPFF